MQEENRRASRRRGALESCWRRIVFAVLVIGALLVSSQVASANPSNPDNFGIAAFTTGVTGSKDAGAHPSVWTKFRFSSITDAGGTWVNGVPRTTEVDLPYGLIGDPSATIKCRRVLLSQNACPPQSLVGHAHIIVTNPRTGELIDHDFHNRPIYNMEPGAGRAAQFALALSPSLNAGVFLDVEVRGDGGLRIVSRNLPANTPVLETTITMWGVPADENPCNPNNPGFDPSAQNPYDPENGLCPTTDPADWERKPFMTSPTECSTVPVTRIRAFSASGRSANASFEEPQAPENCESLVFEPQVEVRPDRREAGAPSALNVEIVVPQNNDPDERATPRLRDVTVALPEGLTINPGTARDLTACLDGEFGRGQEGPARCPAGSKVGSLGITTPLLPEPMPGDIYIGEPKPGHMFRLFLYAAHRGVHIKIEGEAVPDPRTGQVTAVFPDNPALPFSRLSLRFRGGNNSVLALPTTCGTKTTSAALSSWSGQPAVGRVSQFQVYADDAGSQCPDAQPFAPTFVAGTTSSESGADTGLTLTFGRGDQDQYLGALRMELPAGLLGRLADFPRCPVARAEANGCGDESLVGGTTVSAGVGKALLNLPGKVYLTEPMKPGQIAGLAIIVRAVAGPYDLGTVVVKTGITVKPDTSLSVESDPLPTMLEGIALRLRQVTVNVDRPGFMFNPTDCSPKRIEATIASSAGAEAALGSPFQVRGCDKLEFSPPMTIEATAPAPLTRVMGLEVNLGGLGGQANARQVQVVLPPPIGARLDGPVQTQCTEAQFALDACSPESRVGTARADTPILSTPLAGDVFFLENVTGGNLPRLAVRLKGEVLLDLVADVEITVGGRYTTTFGAIPDVPISNFRLKLEEGSQAILTAAPLCGKKLSAERNMIAHNGKFTNDRIPVTVAGCPGKKAKSKKASSKRAGQKARANHKRRRV